MTHRVATPIIQAVTIPAGASAQSEAIDLKEYVPMAFQMPSAWTAADIVPNGQLRGYDSSGTALSWLPIYDDLAAALLIKAAASIVVRVDEKLFWGVTSLKLSSSNSQAAGRIIHVSLVPRLAVVMGGS